MIKINNSAEATNLQINAEAKISMQDSNVSKYNKGYLVYVLKIEFLTYPDF
jgi:hypothetical protein